VADLRKQLAAFQSEFPQRNADVEKQMWQTLALLGGIVVVIWGLLRAQEQALRARVEQIEARAKAMSPRADPQAALEAFTTRLESAARAMQDEGQRAAASLQAINQSAGRIGARLKDLENRVKDLEGR
jgi:uncharacterized protein (DUF3084 family)